MLHLAVNAVHIAVVRSLNMQKTNAVVVQITPQLCLVVLLSLLWVWAYSISCLLIVPRLLSGPKHP
jgi:hypothetical protein